MTIALLSMLIVFVGSSVSLAVSAWRATKSVAARALELDWMNEDVLDAARKLDALYPNAPILPPLIVEQDERKRVERERLEMRERTELAERGRRQQLDAAATTVAELYHLKRTDYAEHRLPDGTTVMQAFVDLYGYAGAIDRARREKEKKPS